MDIKIEYESGKTYGFPNNPEEYVTEYDLNVSTPYKDEIKIEFDNLGIRDVKKVEIRFPKRQAIAFATAILSACQQLEIREDENLLKFHLDEWDLIHNVEKGIAARDLDLALLKLGIKVDQKIILQKLEKYEIKEKQFVPLAIVQKIQEEINKEQV